MDASQILGGIRHQVGITRADLARLCGVSPSTVGRIEKGELDPTWGTFTRILESSGFMLHGEWIVPTGDASAAVAARFVLDRVLDHVLARGSSTPTETSAPTGPAILAALDGPAELQAWWQRWHRAGWLSDAPTTMGIKFLSHHASVVSREGRAAMPRLVVGEGRRWRDLVLRIDEAGFTYAVSDLTTALESPSAGLTDSPRIYVSDLSMVASVLRLESSPSGRGIHLVSAEWPELEDIVVGDGICFTSVGQAIMDNLTGDEAERRNSDRTLSQLMAGILPVG
ncbi:hypothetical protein CFK39_06315 [Brachybacterium avium]|uniref:HTH cro/C1-type domain-containing protein n=1 Tax=Brachybacterium avium TaxID=2017485 RepID=A0A220UBB9_9MICO|nr:helix-turn-helix domain-containing protein [Brachybacterium avium]ASK65508.1 hypothetical protein CFK39_06315 [Brachybacterium avium]